MKFKLIFPVFIGFGLFLGSCMVSRSYSLTGQPIGTKTGVAKSKIIGNSDTSLKKAADNGKITVIGAVEITTKFFIFPFTKTKVYGE
jgi:hypothetical protein